MIFEIGYGEGIQDQNFRLPIEGNNTSHQELKEIIIEKHKRVQQQWMSDVGGCADYILTGNYNKLI